MEQDEGAVPQPKKQVVLALRSQGHTRLREMA